MKQKELPNEMIAIHRNYFNYLKRQRAELYRLRRRVGDFLWFIISSYRSQEEITQELGSVFPAWRHHKGVQK